MRYLLIAILFVFPLGASALSSDVELKQKYAAGSPIKILIVPGHEPFFGGTEHNGLYERELVVLIANRLAAMLQTNPNYSVAVARTSMNWSESLSEYFEEEMKSITAFVTKQKKETEKRLRRGEIESNVLSVPHNTAPTDVALRLYGISKWANEHKYDIVLHLHLNDNPGLSTNSGFVLYVPDDIYENSEVSKAVANPIMEQLRKTSMTSTLAVENYGVSEDQELIAIGAHNTADFASILVEYGYIYESRFADPSVRDAHFSDLAFQTYKGIQSFFGESVADAKSSVVFPYKWKDPVSSAYSTDAYALQVALRGLGMYPAAGELMIECPISGYMGACTKRAVKQFQSAKGLEPVGFVGPRTIAELVKAGF